MSAEVKNYKKQVISKGVDVARLRIAVIFIMLLAGLLSSWSLDGLFLTEISVGGFILCSLVFFKEVSDSNHTQTNNF